jgi:hypothetical protein
MSTIVDLLMSALDLLSGRLAELRELLRHALHIGDIVRRGALAII